MVSQYCVTRAGGHDRKSSCRVEDMLPLPADSPPVHQANDTSESLGNPVHLTSTCQHVPCISGLPGFRLNRNGQTKE